MSHNFIPFDGGKELLLAAARASAAGSPRSPMLVDHCAVPLWLRLNANIINVACPNMENFAAVMATLMLRERRRHLGASTNQVTMICVRGPETKACSSSRCERRAVVHLKEITQQRGQPSAVSMSHAGGAGPGTGRGSLQVASPDGVPASSSRAAASSGHRAGYESLSDSPWSSAGDVSEGEAEVEEVEE